MDKPVDSHTGSAGAEAICRLVDQRADREDREELSRFVKNFYAASSPEDLVATRSEELYAVACSIWRFGANRRPGQAKVKVFNPTVKRDGWHTPHTVIQIVNDDMPFLVDSITGEVTAFRHLTIHAIYHPVMLVERDPSGHRERTLRTFVGESVAGRSTRESYIYLEIDAQSDAAVLKDIERSIRQVLEDVRLAVKDWKPILAQLNDTIAQTRSAPIEPDRRLELLEFMRWLLDDHFTFLGYREYRRQRQDGGWSELRTVKNSGLGILRDAGRYVLKGPKGLAPVSPEIRDFIASSAEVIVTKANVKTKIHRPVYLDYIGIKIFDEEGAAVGERRFVGLFTSQSYARRAQEVPLLRHKIRNVQRMATFDRRGHAGKALMHVLETFPRDELFQADEDELLSTSLAILHLAERPRTRAFIRPDKYGRYVSVLVYVPRDRYHSGLRHRVEQILTEAFNGHISGYNALVTDDVLARWHFIIGTHPDTRPEFNEAEINQRIAQAARGWGEQLNDLLIQRFGEEEGNRLFAKYEHVFSVGYQEAFGAAQAVRDIRKLEQLEGDETVLFDFYRFDMDAENSLRLKIYSSSGLISLSEVLPMLENLGLNVIGENSYELHGRGGGAILDFYLESQSGDAIYLEGLELVLEELMIQVWHGRIENDGFNALTVCSGFSCRETVILRAYAKYLRQVGLPFSQEYVEDCLCAHPDIARALVDLFHTLFDPTLGDKAEREHEAQLLKKSIRIVLDRIQSLDRDRILRNYLSAILATLRTNFYQDEFAETLTRGDREIGLALKIDSKRLEEVPLPRPFVEIFVYSPRVEGIHLRGGKVARGGIRWSDRREDFRTEILGLMKAQQVKNVVIVPVGAKGGFYPKWLPTDGDRTAVMAEGKACYRIFISSLLSVTDNLKKDRVSPPKQTVRWDGADPYLVVAADKGTATFSDIANDISAKYGFWLGDAFASGGSNGYDHKKLAITARGAWVSVARHFRELGFDVNKDPISVIGVGDMSGDVFGNGMLRSKSLKLIAAFDHRDIFFDPDPDPAVSYAERRRLFRKERSSWADYNPQKISEGGGVYSRAAKSIRLTPQMRDFLGVELDELTPNAVIRAMLRAPADLLWMGGIGTYVKASDESHADAGDRSNDALRADAADLRVRVIGEGGNLGLTQPARIEFARRGGRANTDFVDNSAGVDCSDKEVNIKILLASAMERGTLQPDQRHKLLFQMRDDVANIVLRDNYLQTQSISLTEARAAKDIVQHAGLIRSLERAERLDREIEHLPGEEEINELKAAQKGLTRPELAVLIAYSKMVLHDSLLKSDLLKSEVLVPELQQGFPRRLHTDFAEDLAEHRLRREIIATTLANEIVNRAGPTFIYDVQEETGLASAEIAAAYLAVRNIFNLSELWQGIDALDYKVAAATQILIHNKVVDHLRNQTIWILRHSRQPVNVISVVSEYLDGVRTLMKSPERILSPEASNAFVQEAAECRSLGLPSRLAKSIAFLSVIGAASDIVMVANRLNRDVVEVGSAYFRLGHQMGFDWLRRQLETLIGKDHWDYLAAHAIVDEIADQHRNLTGAILSKRRGMKGSKAVDDWLKGQKEIRSRAERLITELKSSGAMNVAKLSFAARHLKSLLPRQS